MKTLTSFPTKSIGCVSALSVHQKKPIWRQRFKNEADLQQLFSVFALP